jgi:vacuolar-type H+-ATPase subunit F/Vma7
MSAAEFVGDEVSAAGYRLCGIDTHVADSRNALDLVRRACEHASLVLIGSSTANSINRAELDVLLRGIAPPVLIVPDVRGLQDVPDIAARIYKQLGMLE